MSVPEHRKSLSEIPESRPSTAEISRVFRDFKQVIQIHKYQTPLQRANQLRARQGSIALSQKLMWEAELVFNLLPPGHRTRLKVDFLRLLLGTDRQVHIRIPVTLMSLDKDLILMHADSEGRIAMQRFGLFKQAFTAFKAKVDRAGSLKPYLPKYVHKSTQCIATFHFSSESATGAWLGAMGKEQRLQQYVQPVTKSVSLVRVHWKDSSPNPTFYFICHGPSHAKVDKSLIVNVPGLARSFSETNIETFNASINRSSTNLIVQKSKVIPELHTAIQDCVHLLNATLTGNKRVAEAVFDFVSDNERRWVFLACKGYRLIIREKIRIKTLEQKREIDVRYLMFPVVARKSIVKRRVKRSMKLGAIAVQRRVGVLGLLKRTQDDYHPIRDPTLVGASSLLDVSSVFEQAGAKSENEADLSFDHSEGSLHPHIDDSSITIVDREVSRYEILVKGSRIYKEQRMANADLVEKHGGEAFWRPVLGELILSLMQDPDFGGYFEEPISFEELFMIVSCMLRILRGNYNFYYREALGKLHEKKNIKQNHFWSFVSAIEHTLRDMQIPSHDVQLIFGRFSQLESTICALKCEGEVEIGPRVTYPKDEHCLGSKG